MRQVIGRPNNSPSAEALTVCDVLVNRADPLVMNDTFFCSSGNAGAPPSRSETLSTTPPSAVRQDVVVEAYEGCRRPASALLPSRSHAEILTNALRIGSVLTLVFGSSGGKNDLPDTILAGGSMRACWHRTSSPTSPPNTHERRAALGGSFMPMGQRAPDAVRVPHHPTRTTYLEERP
jgi:hypothetical protein